MVALNEALHGDITPSYIAGIAMPNLYVAVKRATARNTVTLATLVTDKVVGIAQNVALLDEAVAVKATGRSYATVGVGWWLKGSKLTPAANGTLIATVVGTDFVCAIAEEIANAGEFGEVTILEIPMVWSAIA